MIGSFSLSLQETINECVLISEENIKGIQNDEFFFTFSLAKTKQDIEFACILQAALFPGSPHTQMGPGTRLPSRSIQLHLIS